MPRKYKAKRFRQRGRLGDHNVRLFTWQRVQQRMYKSEAVIDQLQDRQMGDLFAALNDLRDWAVDQGVDVQAVLLEEMEELKDELERETPYDPDGPNDPPLHAREDWHLRVHTRGDSKFTVSITNRKDYIQFLEERGGRKDHPGSDDPGWISDAFDHFRLRLGERISR